MSHFNDHVHDRHDVVDLVGYRPNALLRLCFSCLAILLVSDTVEDGPQRIVYRFHTANLRY